MWNLYQLQTSRKSFQWKEKIPAAASKTQTGNDGYPVHNLNSLLRDQGDFLLPHGAIRLVHLIADHYFRNGRTCSSTISLPNVDNLLVILFIHKSTKTWLFVYILLFIDCFNTWPTSPRPSCLYTEWSVEGSPGLDPSLDHRWTILDATLWRPSSLCACWICTCISEPRLWIPRGVQRCISTKDPRINRQKVGINWERKKFNMWSNYR